MKNIPRITIYRLSQYYRCLEEFEEKGWTRISSQILADELGIKATQLRKDLTHFGQFGVRGLGYDINKLKKSIGKVLGNHKPWNIVVIGAGALGSALASYAGFSKHNFFIEGLFDIDPNKINTTIHGAKIYPMDKLSEFVKSKNISIAILAVPASSAIGAITLVWKSGISAVLNFVPLRLKPPPGCQVRQVDLSTTLESLTYFLTRRSSFK